MDDMFSLAVVSLLVWLIRACGVHVLLSDGVIDLLFEGGE